MSAEPEATVASVRAARDMLGRGRISEAESLLIEVVQKEPRCVPALLLLASIAQRRGHPENAVLAIERAIAVEPDSVELWGQLGAVHASHAYWSDAERAYATAVALAPGDLARLHDLTAVQVAGQRLQAAQATCATLLRRHPESFEAHVLDGDIAAALGATDRARAAYERALSIKPACARAWARLVEMGSPSAADARAQAFAALADSAATSAADRADIEFARAKIAEQEAQFDAAFEHYTRANEAQREVLAARGVVYDAAVSTRRMAAIEQRYPRALAGESLPPLPIALRPIFIVGMPRSGTTLVEQILAMHPQVAAGGELPAIQVCEARFLRLRAQSGLASAAAAGEPRERELLMQMRERYVEALFEAGLDAPFVTDKFPGNFRSLGFIRSMFRDATIVHCVRDARATCWSIFTANLGAHAPSYTSLEDLAHDYLLYRRLMRHWQAVLSPPMVEVRYESLVRQPEEETRRLLSACGLDWDPRCLDFHMAAHPVTTASVFQVRRPLYGTAVDRWRAYQAKLGSLHALGE